MERVDHKFSADQPIRSAEEDRFDRIQFAKTLVSAISGWKAKESLVIALFGTWGTGKTSVKNLAVAELAKTSDASPEIVEFRPWEWSGQQKITQAFFNELANAIGRKDSSKKKRAVASKLRRYSLFLETGSIFAEGIKSITTVILTIAALLGVWGTMPTDETTRLIVSFIILALLCLAVLFKWGGRFIGSLSDAISHIAEEAKMSLEEYKQSLADELRRLDRAILVIIDDIDRLTPSETRTVFQLVKANANFPNTVYLLLFQRDIVEEQLKDESQSGADFLEKIIQVPFDLPRIDRPRLEKFLFENLDSVLEEDPMILERFDKTRWGNIYHGGIHEFFTTPRSVYRFTSTLSFYVSLLRGEKAFEVNPIDLIAVEALRVFLPKVHKSIATQKELLTSTHEDQSDREDSIRQIDLILKAAPEIHQSAAREILKQLFPPIESLLGGNSYGSESYDEWFKSLRICHPDLFARYFQFVIPEGDISQSELAALIELSEDQAAFLQRLESLRERNLLHPTLSYLDTYKQDIPLNNSTSFIAALMDIADDTEDEFHGHTGISSSLHLSRIVNWYLRQSESQQTRGQLLLAAFEHTKGLSLMAGILASDQGRREKPEQSLETLIDDASFDTGKKVFLIRIRDLSASDPDSLLRNRHLATLLYRWKNWGGTEEVRDWIAKTIAEPSTMLTFLDTFVTQSYHQTIGDHVGRIKNRLSLSAIEEFINIEQVREWAAGMDRTKATEHDLRILEALDRAFERRKKGYADDSFDPYDD